MPVKPQVNDWIGAGRAFVRGIPIGGELLDEGLAAADATFGGDRSKSWGERWSNDVEEQRSYDAAYDARHPYLSTALQTAGNFVMPGGAVLGAAAKLPLAARAVRLVGGQLLAPKSNLARNLVQEVAKGAIEGAADGFLAGKGGIAERTQDAAREAVRGAAWGALHPLLAKGFGKEVADGTNLREGLRAQQRAEGILGRLEAGGPLLGVLPLPWQTY